MMIFLLLFVNLIESKEICIYPHFYWVNNNAFTNNNNWPLIETNQIIQTEIFTQCGVKWIDLFLKDITLVKQNNQLWLLLFQEYCQSSLNYIKIKNNLDKLSQNQLNEIQNLDEYLIKALDILNRYCDKMADLNYFESKLYTINILKNLSIINDGKIIEYCNDIYFPSLLNFNMYSIFQNISFKDNSQFNETAFINVKPLYFDFENKTKQFISGNWVMNIEINKNTALILFIIILLMCFALVSQTWLYFGKCFQIRKKNQSNHEDENNFSCCATFYVCLCLYSRKFTNFFCCCFYKKRTSFPMVDFDTVSTTNDDLKKTD